MVGPWGQQQPTLEGAERYGAAGPDRGTGHGTRVGVHPAGRVHGDCPFRWGQGRELRVRTPQPAPPADTEQAVEDEVGCVGEPCRLVATAATATATATVPGEPVDPAARGEQRGAAL